MKKFIKWFLFSLFVACGLALGLGYIFAGDQTKAVVDTIVEYLNTPLGIIGGTSVTIGTIAYFVISHIFNLNRQKVQENYQKLVEEYKDKIAEYENAYNQLKDKERDIVEHINKVEMAQYQNTKNMQEILKLIPNKKVQSKLGELYGEREERTND